MSRYVLGYEDLQIIGPAWGTLWERPIINNLLRFRLPDHGQDHLPLSDCCVGTLEWTGTDKIFSIIWKLSDEAPMYLAPDNEWTENRKEALLLDRGEAEQIASDKGCGARVCLGLSDLAGKGR